MSEATQALRRQQSDERAAKRAGALDGLEHPIDVPEGEPIPATEGDALEGLAAAVTATKARKKRAKKGDKPTA